MISYQYGFNHLFMRLYVNKRIGQLVGASITPIESDHCYIAGVTNYDKYAIIDVTVDSRPFQFMDDIFDLVLNNIKINKYINFNSHRLSYELLRALS